MNLKGGCVVCSRLDYAATCFCPCLPNNQTVDGKDRPSSNHQHSLRTVFPASFIGLFSKKKNEFRTTLPTILIRVHFVPSQLFRLRFAFGRAELQFDPLLRTSPSNNFVDETSLDRKAWLDVDHCLRTFTFLKFGLNHDEACFDAVLLSLGHSTCFGRLPTAVLNQPRRSLSPLRTSRKDANLSTSLGFGYSSYQSVLGLESAF